MSHLPRALHLLASGETRPSSSTRSRLLVLSATGSGAGSVASGATYTPDAGESNEQRNFGFINTLDLVLQQSDLQIPL